MESESKETFGQTVKRLAKENGWKRDAITRGAQISVPTWQEITEDALPAFVGMPLRRKKKWVQSIVRLAHFFKEDASLWLKMASLDSQEKWVQAIIEDGGSFGKNNEEATIVATRIANQQLTAEDLEFLIVVQNGLKQPLTFGLAFELILLRTPSPVPSSTLPK